MLPSMVHTESGEWRSGEQEKVLEAVERDTEEEQEGMRKTVSIL